jgi:WD40 repeat protein
LKNFNIQRCAIRHPGESFMEEFSRSFGFFVGIDQYGRGIPKLKTPVSDARALARLLREQHGFETYLLTNEQATLAEMRALFEGLVSGDPNIQNQLRKTVGNIPLPVWEDDRVLFYFAGHGAAVTGEDGPEGFILPQDADREREDSFLPMTELNEALAKLKCRHFLGILDCCFAGAFRWSSTRDLLARPPRLYRERYAWYIHGKAWQAIASTAHDERALDVAAGRPLGERNESGPGHSPFAEALLDGLKGKADQAFVGEILDGVITATDLFSFIEKQLRPPEGSQWMPQTPIFWPLKNHERGEFIFLVPGTEKADLPPAPPLNEENNPWRGLEPYGQEHKGLFFGRRVATETLRDRLLGEAATETEPEKDAENFLVVTGPSGIGKSSLVRAGLLPRLEETLRFEYKNLQPIVVKPGPSPLASLAAALKEAGGDAASIDELALKTDRMALAQWIKHQSDDSFTVLVIDQAEELITNSKPRTVEAAAAKASYISKASAAIEILLQRAGLTRGPREVVSQITLTPPVEADLFQTYLGLLVTALNERPNLKVVLTVRSEFEPQFATSPLADRWAKARYVVPQMTQDELRRVIEQPPSVTVIRFENEGLVDRLVNEVVQMPGALPLLSFALSEMYLNYLRRDADDRTISWKDYNALQADGDPGIEGNAAGGNGLGFDAGVTGALRFKANQLLNKLDDIHKATARRLLERLVAVEGGQYARRRVPQSELVASAGPENHRIEEIKKRLLEARLVVTDRVDDEPSIELAHDALILGWDRLLTWVREDALLIADLRRLTPDAEAWHSAPSGKSGLLWADPARVDIVKKLQEAPSPGLNKTEAIFATASVERAKRNQFRRWSLSAILLVLTIGATVAAVVAEHQRRSAVSRQLAAQAEQVLSDDRADSLDKAIAGWETDRTAEAKLAIADAFPQLRSSLEGHQGAVNFAAFAPDSHRVVTASMDNSARIWDSTDGHQLLALEGHKGPIWRGEFSPDGTRVVTASADGLAQVWDAETGRTLYQLDGHRGNVWSAKFSPDGQFIVTANEYNTAILWNARDGTQLATLLDSNGISQGSRRIPALGSHIDSAGDVKSVAFSPDSRRLLASGDDGIARLWSVSDGKLLARLEGHVAAIKHLEYSRDGKLIVTASDDGTAIIWNGENGKLLYHLHGDGAINDAEFSFDGGRVVTAGDDQTARLWDTSNGRLLLELIGHLKKVRHAAFSPNDGWIVSSSDDTSARIWDAANGHLLANIQGHSGSVGISEFSPDGSTVLTASSDGLAALWNVVSSELVNTIIQKSALNQAIFSLGGEYVVTAGEHGRAAEWNARIARLIRDLKGDNSTVLRIAFSPDGLRIVTASESGSGFLWNFADGRLMAKLVGHSGAINYVEFSHDGKRIVTASDDSTARIWNGETGQLIAELKGHRDKVWHAAFSQDDQEIVTASEDASAIVWDGVDGTLRVQLIGHSASVVSAVFSSDRRRVLTASQDNTARVWNAADGSVLLVLNGHSGPVEDAAFSRDDQRIATASDDRTARLWNASNGQIIAILEGHKQGLDHATFAPVGELLVTTASDNTPRVWNAMDGKPIAALEGHSDPLVGTVIDAAFSEKADRIVTAGRDGQARIFRLVTLADLAKMLSDRDSLF